jgi:predicted anti-sigma-YlaC factor YlaD
MKNQQIQCRQKTVTMSKNRWLCWMICGLLLLGLGTGCSLKKMAVRQMGNALAGGGTTFTSDNDPELVKAALPFSLKLMESLLAESPRHEKLLFATASGFTQFAFAFVQQEADELEDTDAAAAETQRIRARKLYLRARDYALRGLDVRHSGFSAGLKQNPRETVRLAKINDVPLMYWTAVAWGAAIAVSKDQPELIGDQPVIEALIERALALDPDYDQGAIHSFLITFEMARASSGSDAESRARRHFDQAMALAKGRLAGPLVSLAESVSVPRQDKAEFRVLLERALAIDPDAHPDFRLVNLVMQRRAKWLLARIDDLFFEPVKP